MRDKLRCMDIVGSLAVKELGRKLVFMGYMALGERALVMGCVGLYCTYTGVLPGKVKEWYGIPLIWHVLSPCSVFCRVLQCISAVRLGYWWVSELLMTRSHRYQPMHSNCPGGILRLSASTEVEGAIGATM